MIDTPQIVQTEAQPIALIHIVVPRSDIQTVMMPGLQELMSTLAAQGVTPTGPWFNHHLKRPGEIFDFELGVPVAKPIVPAGRVTNGTLPAARVARTIYHGDYSGLLAAWGEFIQWIKSGGRKIDPTLWEIYRVNPSTTSNPSEWQTELNQPLID